ncbi:MAG: NADH:flavin oxidoreductase/NADH oxidase [Legionellaceae bacterium]|nr:NADH:flavin oxidoreductase/NADH oxidase [Legionellaceae bacterium]
MHHTPQLFMPLQIKTITFKNRIWISPMCQYSCVQGYPGDWHLVHLGSRAVGGAGLVMLEATAVSPEGRISPHDSGIWSDEQVSAFKRLSDTIKSQGAVSGIQIAHAGRKGSIAAPWDGDKRIPLSEGGWQTIAPSALPFKADDPPPKAMDSADRAHILDAFVAAARRCVQAGFQVLEIHMAHGYLMHQFLSPLANQRQDEYGGSLENRLRFPLEVAAAVRQQWPQHLPLFVRISATDWVGGVEELADISPQEQLPVASWNLAESMVFCRQLKALGVDLIDCSTGGTLPNVRIPFGPGYQVPFASAIRRDADILTAAVGMISEPMQAESILLQQQADAIFIGRASLRNPYWPQYAAGLLGVELEKARQYQRS